MAGITFEGVGGGGALFEGLKLFFVLRVPSRNYYMDLFKANGGEVSKLDKHADYIIADHALKNLAPVGSISWKFIEQSVKKGVLEDPDDYRVGPVTHTARPVGSGGPTKYGRTLFTQEDDRFLTDWVMRGERAGMPTRGNELFIQLEEANPRHTFQSWRDRWIKYVEQRPRPSSPDENWDAGRGPTAVSTEKKGKRSNSKQATAGPTLNRGPPRTHSERGISKKPSATARPPSKEIGSSSHSIRSSSQPPLPVKSTGGTKFTKKEISLLKDSYDDIINIHEDKELDAWMTWSNAYPNHTAQEWRNYFIREFSPLFEAKRNRRSRKEKPIPPSKPSAAHSEKDEPAPPSKMTAAAEMSEIPVNTAKAEKSVSKPIGNQSSTPVNTDPSLTDEATFESCLMIVAEGLEDVGKITFNPTIRGKTITLYKLWQVVKAEFGGNAEVTGLGLWPQVAKKLGFKSSELTEAAGDLRDCYDEVLTDYEEAREDYLNALNESDEMTESQEEELLRNQLIPPQPEEVNDEEGTPEIDDEDDDLNAPVASPTLPVSNKRTLAYRSTQNGTSPTELSGKRQRIEKGKGKEREIPSTPDQLLDVARTPTKAYQSSPLKNVQIFADEEDEHSDGDSIIKPFVQPDFIGLEPRRRVAEPETQDFYFVAPEEEERVDTRRRPGSYPSSPPQAITSSKSSSRNQSTRVPEKVVSEKQQANSPDTFLEYIDHHEALGYSREIVIAALEATTYTSDANLIMEDLQQGRGIPPLIAGVWTAKDDEACVVEDTPGFKRMVAKHGMDRVRQRQNYLKEKEVAEKMRVEELERAFPSRLV